MTRLERNRLKRAKKKRKCYFALGLSICIFTLIGGLWLTNDIMVKMTGLPKEEDLFNLDSTIEYIKYTANVLRDTSTWVGDKIVRIYNNMTQWLRSLKW